MNSLLAITPAELVVVGCDPRGSHVVDAFVNSTSISAKNKEKLIYRFKVHFYNCGVYIFKNIISLNNINNVKS